MPVESLHNGRKVSHTAAILSVISASFASTDSGVAMTALILGALRNNITPLVRRNICTGPDIRATCVRPKRGTQPLALVQRLPLRDN
jgi:hypothetical protein